MGPEIDQFIVGHRANYGQALKRKAYNLLLPRRQSRTIFDYEELAQKRLTEEQKGVTAMKLNEHSQVRQSHFKFCTVMIMTVEI